jgi:hypothetical protein
MDLTLKRRKHETEKGFGAGPTFKRDNGRTVNEGEVGKWGKRRENFL